MSSKSVRAEQMLKKMGDRLGMTDCGRNWVTAAIDPFHDEPIRLDGYPDGSGGNSICQLVKQTMTVTAPPGLTSGTWDCSIVDWPHVVNATMVGAYTNNYPAGGGAPTDTQIFQLTTATNTVSTGGLTVWSAATGSQMSASQIANDGVTSVVTTNQITLPALYTSGSHRVVAKGFEVHNTTASLYKGGSVCCWRSPVADLEAAPVYINVLCTTSSITAQIPAKTLLYEGPPATLAATLKLPQSRQWGAEAGCYVPSALHSTYLSKLNGEPAVTFLTDNTSSPTQAVTTRVAAAANVPTTGVTYTFPNTKHSEFDLAGAYFSGMTLQTTLTINWNVYVERFPSNDDLDLVVLANPAPERDDVAIKFYSHAMRELPPGVPVAMNGFGDWFKDVVSTASDYIAPVLSAIPHPAAQGLGMAIKGVNAIANKTGSATTPSPYAGPSLKSAIQQVAVKAKNSQTREKNKLIRAKNEEIRARKALKAAKKK